MLFIVPAIACSTRSFALIRCALSLVVIHDHSNIVMYAIYVFAIIDNSAFDEAATLPSRSHFLNRDVLVVCRSSTTLLDH
uniref:Uncharacterized protein U21 n=1 Tax=Hyposoter didymator TaxID=260305 RepID=D7P5Q2_HYPDD|nr:unknown [Hyposoter didymator]